MLYHLFEWFKNEEVKFPGSSLLGFITFRVLMAVILSLVISTLFGKRIINILSRKQIGESVRDLGLAGEQIKKGTPTMGGIIIILAILIPTLLLANLHKVYIRLMLISTLWLGIIGFIDDYLKMRAKRIAQERGEQYRKGDKDGLAGWFKLAGQIGLGIIVGATLYFNNNVKIWREFIGTPTIKDSTVFLSGSERLFTENAWWFFRNYFCHWTLVIWSLDIGSLDIGHWTLDINHHLSFNVTTDSTTHSVVTIQNLVTILAS